MSKDNEVVAANMILAFLVGAAAGAAVALLFAPTTGREAREFLSEKAREGQDKAAELARQGRDVLNRQRDTLASAIERGREAYQQAAAEKDQA